MMQAFVFISLYECPMYVYVLVGVSLTWWNSAKNKQVVGITQQIRLTEYVCFVQYFEEGGGEGGTQRSCRLRVYRNRFEIEQEVGVVWN
jgi:hypothetical protein